MKPKNFKDNINEKELGKATNFAYEMGKEIGSIGKGMKKLKIR